MWIGKAKWDWLKERIHDYRKQEDHARTIIAAQAGYLKAANMRLDAATAEAERLRQGAAQAVAALREADLLRSRLNAAEIERAALLVRLLPGLEVQVPQLGKLDLSLGHPGSDFDDMGSDDPHSEEIPLPSITDPVTISDHVGELDGPELQSGIVVKRDNSRPPPV